MAQPMTADQIVSQLIKWRIPYGEYRDWRTHNRNSVGSWGPVHGLMVHHTGWDSTDQRDLLYDGLAGLPGPLCNFGLAQNGTVWLIGWGRSNHAGGGDQATLNHVINEDYAGRATNLVPTVGNKDGYVGNGRFYGVEIWYSGSHGMTPAQYDSLLKLAACIDDFHDWGKLSAVAHAEWSSDKWDPGISSGHTMNMVAVRNDIGLTLAAGPDTPPAEDDDVTITKLNQANPTDVTLASDVWLPLAFDGSSPILAGPRTLVGPMYVQLTFGATTPLGTRVVGRFYSIDTDDINGESGYGDIAVTYAGAGVQFVHNYDVPTDRHLRFKVKAITATGAPVTLTHRVVTGDYVV